ncbi:hypothetical protein BGW36DRAFT_84782 [Talaromyces proteolyticus]|uniref:Microbial-type PARG catalytic domain-containing protein n=1 Tax=Talaromyces proteolyticus TaxID=1131652 RepID=A0AAD4Q238_9EURO|nr:uncharacterized protein BGW36DRAFT_84782 [Talaromyces proteolyticus]KAH8703277.1 hypothetical protein BGW36DRAFT_84782 [Talaromyces proteolyticus]
MSHRGMRQRIAKETQKLTPGIIRSTKGATADAEFYPELLPALQENKKPRDTRVYVDYGDSFTVAQRLLAARRTNIAVLNMASDQLPGGGWLRGALAQEEALCLRSTLAATLNPSHYPTPPLAATWSPGVAVFREDTNHNCTLLKKDDHFVVSVVSMAGLRRPPLTGDELDYRFPKDTELVKNKIRQVLRLMALNRTSCCVLGALGCGVFGNPPKRVAQLFRNVILEDEFRGRFDEIVFAILDRALVGNFEIFRDIIGDFIMDSKPAVA